MFRHEGVAGDPELDCVSARGEAGGRVNQSVLVRPCSGMDDPLGTACSRSRSGEGGEVVLADQRPPAQESARVTVDRPVRPTSPVHGERAVGTPGQDAVTIGPRDGVLAHRSRRPGSPPDRDPRAGSVRSGCARRRRHLAVKAETGDPTEGVDPGVGSVRRRSAQPAGRSRRAIRSASSSRALHGVDATIPLRPAPEGGAVVLMSRRQFSGGCRGSSP